jgi:F-type H+-transporting ATPase subunit epsilon
MAKNFHLDIITPTSIQSFDDISYLRIPGLDGLIGIQAKHSNAIIGLDIGEIKLHQNGKKIIYATSGGFADIAKEGVQLLLETVEPSNTINTERAKKALKRGKNRLSDKKCDLDRANQAIKRANNRLRIAQALSKK